MSTIVTRSGKGVPLTATDHDNNVNNLNTDKVETLADLSISSTATEINLLDGVTATTAELNYVDGVTSNIQTQLGTKLPLAGGTMTGTIAGFTSTGIDDNATSTAITIDASENVGIGTTTPDSSLEIYKASTAELMIGSDNGGTAQISLYESNSTTKEATIKYDGSANNLVIGTSGQANAIVIPRDSGYVTMPNQPSFRANVNMANLGSGTTTLTLSEVYDVGGNLASNVFTAPVTGKYLLTYSLYLLDIDFATTNITIQINTSNKNYGNTFEPDEFMKDGDAAHSFTMSNVCDMDAGDTADFRIYYASGSLVLDVHSDSAVTGHLLG